MGKEVGGVQNGGDMYTHGGFMSMYGKNHYNIVISLQLNLYLKKKVTFDMGFKVWAGVWEKMKVQRAL